MIEVEIRLQNLDDHVVNKNEPNQLFMSFRGGHSLQFVIHGRQLIWLVSVYKRVIKTSRQQIDHEKYRAISEGILKLQAKWLVCYENFTQMREDEQNSLCESKANRFEIQTFMASWR